MGGVAEVSQEPDIEATQPAGRDHQIVPNSTGQPKIAVPSQSLKNGPRWGGGYLLPCLLDSSTSRDGLLRRAPRLGESGSMICSWAVLSYT